MQIVQLLSKAMPHPPLIAIQRPKAAMSAGVAVAIAVVVVVVNALSAAKVP
jgi:hypothetical protein